MSPETFAVLYARMLSEQPRLKSTLTNLLEDPLSPEQAESLWAQISPVAQLLAEVGLVTSQSLQGDIGGVVFTLDTQEPYEAETVLQALFALTTDPDVKSGNVRQITLNVMD